MVVRRSIVAAAVLLALTGCTPSDIARNNMRNESEQQCGVMRTVTAYSTTGEKIGEWHGKIDVQYAHDTDYKSGVSGDRVDIVVFDGNNAVDRVIVSGAIVVVDND